MLPKLFLLLSSYKYEKEEKKYIAVDLLVLPATRLIIQKISEVSEDAKFLLEILKRKRKLVQFFYSYWFIYLLNNIYTFQISICQIAVNTENKNCNSILWMNIWKWMYYLIFFVFNIPNCK